MTRTTPGTTRRTMRTRRALAMLISLVVAVGIASPTVGDAAITDRSTIHGNRFNSDPAITNPYGLYNATVAPFIGAAFSDQAKGQMRFQLTAAGNNPAPYPRMLTGDQIIIRAELSAALRFTDAFGFCDPTTWSSSLKRYVTIDCDTAEHPNGSATAAITITAVQNSAPIMWSALRTFSIGIIAPDGRVDAGYSSNVSISYPDDADHHRKRTATMHYSTVAGHATDMDVRTVSTSKDHGSQDWYLGDKGHVRIDTGLADPASHGVTMKRGESFTYALNFIWFSQGNFTLDPAPDSAGSDNVCTRVVAGYSFECRTGGVNGELVEVVTTRTGPDIVNDKPLGGVFRIPVRSAYDGTGGASDHARVVLSADMEQFGSRILTGSAALQLHAGIDHARVYQPKALPDAGGTFARGDGGQVSFAFFDPAATVRPPGYSMYYGGGKFVTTLRLPAEVELLTDPSADGAARNWCDGRPWSGDIANALQTPTCSSSIDTSGPAPVRVVTVTAKSLTAGDRTYLWNNYLPDDFAIRIRHGETAGVTPTIHATLQAITASGALAWESEQSGTYEIDEPPAALGVHDLTAAPYVGEAFSADGEGEVSFDFFPGDAPVGSLLQGGDTITATLALGKSFEPSLDASSPEQGTDARNWCDGFDNWNSGLQGFLGTPDCTITQDPATGEFTAAVTARALQDVPNDRLANGFTIRVRAWHTLADGDQRITGTLTSSRSDAVAPGAVTDAIDVPVTDRPSSSLGVWSAEAQTNDADATWPAAQEGHVSWYSDPHSASAPVVPFAIRTGQTITYRVQLPAGLTYRETSTIGADNICTEPARYVGFTASCDIGSDSVEYVLTRTGPDDDAAAIGDTKVFTIPVVNTSTGSVVRDDVVIGVRTTIRQAGSARARAVLPVELTATTAAREDTTDD